MVKFVCTRRCFLGAGFELESERVGVMEKGTVMEALSMKVNKQLFHCPTRVQFATGWATNVSIEGDVNLEQLEVYSCLHDEAPVYGGASHDARQIESLSADQHIDVLEELAGFVRCTEGWVSKSVLVLVEVESIEERTSDVEDLFDVFDFNGDGSLSFREFRLACLLAIHDEEKVQAVFDELDEDGSGEVSMAEFVKGFNIVQAEMRNQAKMVWALQQEAEALEDAGDSLEVQLTAAQVALERTRQEAEALESAGDGLEQELSVTKVALERTRQEAEALETAGDGLERELQRTLAESTMQLAVSRGENVALCEEKDALARELRQAREQCEALRAEAGRAAAMQETESSLRKEAAALEDAGDDLETELKAAREEIAMLEEGMKASRASADERATAQLKQEVSELKEEITMLEGGMQRLSKREQAMAAQRDAMEEQVATALLNATLTPERTKPQDSSQTSSPRTAELEAQLLRAREEAASAIRERDAASAEREKALLQLKAARDELGSARAEKCAVESQLSGALLRAPAAPLATVTSAVSGARDVHDSYVSLMTIKAAISGTRNNALQAAKALERTQQMLRDMEANDVSYMDNVRDQLQSMRTAV